MKEVIRGGGGGVGGVEEERLPSLALGNEADPHGASTRGRTSLYLHSRKSSRASRRSLLEEFVSGAEQNPRQSRCRNISRHRSDCKAVGLRPCLHKVISQRFKS